MQELQNHIQYLEDLLRANKIDFTPLGLSQIQPRTAVPHPILHTNVEDLSYDHIDRYKRQMLLKEIAYEGQVRLNKSRVLVVGAGGIGGPAAFYLAGAGVGTIGIVDGDKVEISNLHRQIIHTTDRVGINKCLSAKEQLRQFNPLVNVETHLFHLTPENAADVVKQYDLVLDASDNPQTRYLINDACIILKKPLISGSSVGWEGQLSVFGYQDGPCYRCLFPDCPKGVKNCNEAGVFGALPGIIGLLESLEAVKIILGQGTTQSQRMVLIDGLRGTLKTVRLRNKQSSCVVCGSDPSLKDVSTYDYKAFTATCSTVIPASDNYQNVSWEAFLKTPLEQSILLDCRPKEQAHILNFQEFKSVPWVDVCEMSPEEVQAKIENNPQKPIFIMCRRGNQSRLMCDYLHNIGYKNLHNIIGGINSFATQFDPSMPLLE